MRIFQDTNKNENQKWKNKKTKTKKYKKSIKNEVISKKRNKWKPPSCWRHWVGAEFYKFHLGNGWQQKFVRMWAVSVSHQGKSTAGRDNNKAKSYNCDVSVDFTALTLAPFLPKTTIFPASSSILPLTNTHHKKALSLTSMPLKTKQNKKNVCCRHYDWGIYISF